MGSPSLTNRNGNRSMGKRPGWSSSQFRLIAVAVTRLDNIPRTAAKAYTTDHKRASHRAVDLQPRGRLR